MLASITPLGERGHGRRWGTTAAAYVAGSALGGATAGAVAGLAGAALPRPTTAVVAVLAGVLGLAGAALDLRPGRLPLPTVHRQVDEDWLHRYRGWVVGVGFGVQLGLGVVTIVTTAAVYVALALALLTGSPAAGALVGLVYGLARALPVLGLARMRTPDALRRLHRRLAAADGRARAATVAVQGAAGLIGLAAALASGGVR